MTLAAFCSGNRVLDALPAAYRAGIERDSPIVTLSAHQTTNSAGDSLTHVDFPIDAVLSVVATLSNGRSVEVATVGREGFVEAEAALATSLASRSTFCQVRGRVRRMPFERFAERMTDLGFARLMHHNVRATLFCAQQFAACNVRHALVQRCARWLLMTADRVGSPTFTLTDDFLSIMLGVDVDGVAQASQTLRRIGAIESRGASLTIVDTAILTEAACECYAACLRAFDAALVG